MNSKQRRKLVRKYKEKILLVRVESRLNGGDGHPSWSDTTLARDLEWQNSRRGRRWRDEQLQRLMEEQ